MNSDPNCLSCRSNSGEQRISPGPTIYTGQYWLIEHAYPTRLLGWVVAVLKRHTEALHDLAAAEWRELAEIQAALLPVLASATSCQKEYAACFAELPGFKHIHFHFIPRPAGLPEELLGTRAFALLKVDAAEAVPAESVRQFCQQVGDELRQRLSPMPYAETFGKLLAITQGLERRFPNGNDPFQVMTRLLEESGELAREVNHFEGSGVKREKYGPPDPAHLAKEVMDVLRCAMQVASHYHILPELQATVETSYERLLYEGYL